MPQLALTESRKQEIINAVSDFVTQQHKFQQKASSEAAQVAGVMGDDAILAHHMRKNFTTKLNRFLADRNVTFEDIEMVPDAIRYFTDKNRNVALFTIYEKYQANKAPVLAEAVSVSANLTSETVPLAQAKILSEEPTAADAFGKSAKETENAISEQNTKPSL